MEIAGEYREVIEPLQEALVNYYDTIPEKNRELVGKILAKLALPVTKTMEGSSLKEIGYIPIMNMVPTKTSKRKVLKKDDRVYHPSHYTWLKELCGVEVIDITRHMDFDLGCVLKYVLRAGKKQEKGLSDIEKEIEDLSKAVFYLNDKIAFLKDEQRNLEKSSQV